MRTSLVVLGVSLLTGLTGCQGKSSQMNMTVFGQSMQPLRERFNVEKDRPRVVGLFSPV
jgi:hypothetical protein